MTEQRASELLKPCPFCGKDDSDDNAVQEAAVVLRSFKAASGGRAHRVECACGTFGPSHRFAEEAIAAWNTRATPFAESAKSPSDSVREALQGFVADLTNGGKNPANMLSIDHDALKARIVQALATLRSIKDQGNG